MPTPVRNVKPTRPASGEKPNRIAPVAPVKPTCDSAWPANVCPRSTRKNPTVPASTAAMPEAANAVRMKSYSSMGAMGVIFVAMRLTLDFDAFVGRHHEIAVPGANDFDPGAIEARQHRPVDDVVDGADHRCARPQIKNPVDGVDQRVELVRAEHDRDLEVVANALRGFDDALLMRGIE